jgi:hypothetical protein
MGTTLTGTTPQDTYDSLIKVTDNGPLTGSLKKLTDGLGNDSSLSLSTTAASLSGTLAVTGTSTFNSGQNVLYASFDNDAALFQRVGAYGAVIRLGRSGVSQTATIDYPTDGTLALSTVGVERMRITASGNVGIGTDAPTRQLSISATNPQMVLKSTTTTGFSELYFGDSAADNGFVGYAHNGDYMYFGTNNAEKVRILSGGGITFNGDTTQANALDDYEEGTWTMGVSFGGASVGVTYTSQGGTYTKIGRQVTVNGFIILSSKGSSVGGADITGLPFTSGNTTGNNPSASVWLFNVSFANQFQAVGNQNATTITLYETTEAGAVSGLEDTNFANDSRIAVNLTYFV